MPVVSVQAEWQKVGEAEEEAGTPIGAPQRDDLDAEFEGARSGDRDGREERSWSPESPSSPHRRSHLQAVRTLSPRRGRPPPQPMEHEDPLASDIGLA